jgi:hypothetical protein
MHQRGSGQVNRVSVPLFFFVFSSLCFFLPLFFPESWLAMQDAHDLWLARQSTDLARVSKRELATASQPEQMMKPRNSRGTHFVFLPHPRFIRNAAANQTGHTGLVLA